MFFGLIESVWSAQQADVAFLFMTPHESDQLNKEAGARGDPIWRSGHRLMRVMAIDRAGR